MPGEGAVESLLHEFVEALKKAKDKKEEDVVAIVKSKAGLLNKIGLPYDDILYDKYFDFRTLVAYSQDPSKETKYVNLFIDDIEKIVNHMIEVRRENNRPGPDTRTQQGSTRPYRKKFDTCVKAVRRSVKARRGSNKESAAIAICTKSVLQTRGITMKKYRKGRLLTQKKRV